MLFTMALRIGDSFTKFTSGFASAAATTSPNAGAKVCRLGYDRRDLAFYFLPFRRGRVLFAFFSSKRGEVSLSGPNWRSGCL